MNIAIIGGSGHYSFALEGLLLDKTLTLCAIAPGTPGEDIRGVIAACNAHALTPRVYASAEALLDAETLDLVAVNPWFCDNAKIATACLARGLHVYCEKPLATELEDLATLEATWRRGSAALGGMFNLRCAPWFLTLEAAIAAGEIGNVRLLHGQKSYKLGQRGMPYLKRATYGGLIPWVGVHAIDWVLHLGGPCEWVCAAQSEAFNRGHEELEVSASALLRLRDGVIATVSADYLRPDGSARHDDDRLRVTGTRGMLEAVDGRVYLENEHAKRELPLCPAISPFLRFVRAIGTEEATHMALDALDASRVALLAWRAGAEGRALAVPPRDESNRSL